MAAKITASYSLHSTQWFCIQYHIFFLVSLRQHRIKLHRTYYCMEFFIWRACFEHSYFVLKFYFHDVCSLCDHLSVYENVCGRETIAFLTDKNEDSKGMHDWFLCTLIAMERDSNSLQSICRVSYVYMMHSVKFIILTNGQIINHKILCSQCLRKDP